MSDAYFRRVAESYAPYIRKVADDEEKFKEALYLFAKEVERDVRHKAVSMAGLFQRQLQNMTHE